MVPEAAKDIKDDKLRLVTQTSIIMKPQVGYTDFYNNEAKVGCYIVLVWSRDGANKTKAFVKRHSWC